MLGSKKMVGPKKYWVCTKEGPRNLPLMFGQNWFTAEIFLIVTNVARTNVALTNVNLTVGICSRSSQEPTFEVLSKSGQ